MNVHHGISFTPTGTMVGIATIKIGHMLFPVGRTIEGECPVSMQSPSSSRNSPRKKTLEKMPNQISIPIIPRPLPKKNNSTLQNPPSNKRSPQKGAPPPGLGSPTRAIFAGTSGAICDKSSCWSSAPRPHRCGSSSALRCARRVCRPWSLVLRRSTWSSRNPPASDTGEKSEGKKEGNR